jgi:alpha-galactosidase
MVFGGNMIRSSALLVAIFILTLAFCGCGKKLNDDKETQKGSAIEVNASSSAVVIKTGVAEFEILPNGYLKSSLVGDGQHKSLDRADGSSDSVLVNGKEVADFTADLASAKQSDAKGKLGSRGRRVEVIAKSASTGLERKISIEVYDNFPQLAITGVAYRNLGSADIRLNKVVTQRHQLDASLRDKSAKPHQLWAFQGSSLDWGKDEIFPVPGKYFEQNPMGRPGKTGNYGGGIPVNAFWTRDVGMAIGHIETLPLVLDMPIRSEGDKPIEAHIELNDAGTLKPGETFSTPRSFVAVYSGDFYEPLRMYSLALQQEGWKIPKPTNQDYAVAWCGWGYEFDVTPKEMLGTIPELKKLGITWATLDDRWFDTYGDWRPRHETFPGDSMKQMVDDFHKDGIYAQIWWLPIAAEDGKGRWPSHKYIDAQVLKDHPDWLILDKNGKHARITRDLAAMCPALPEVQQYHKQLTEKFIKEWGFDGHKLDNIYTVPACYNPKHKHKSPNDSINAMSEVYKQIFDTTRALKPESVTQSCPCGTTPNIAWLPYMDQAVTADPVGGEQVRQRIKWYKALLGPEAAVYGDHVELSEMSRSGKDGWDEHGRDFASTIGTGGVVGTKFTWPDNNPTRKKVALTPEKEEYWKKWIDLYNQKMLSRGTFRNLYVTGYDTPQGYAIEKDGKMYYAFFTKSADDPFKGEIELRGLPAGKYRAVDYVNKKQLGTVDSANHKLSTEFKGHLLIEAQKL